MTQWIKISCLASELQFILIRRCCLVGERSTTCKTGRKSKKIIKHIFHTWERNSVSIFGLPSTGLNLLPRVPPSCVLKNWNQGIRLGEAKCPSCHVANQVSDLSPHGLIPRVIYSPQRVVEIAKQISKYKFQYPDADTHIFTHIIRFSKIDRCVPRK